MATYSAQRNSIRGWLPALILAGGIFALYTGTCIYDALQPAKHSSFTPPSSEQIQANTERDTRYARLNAEKQRLELLIQATRPKLAARQTSLHTEEKSLQDIQAHIANERQTLNTNDPKACAAFNTLVQDFNRRRSALLQKDKALVSDIADMNDTITRRNQLVVALSAMNKDR